MKVENRRSNFAQNRIAYIVYGNPKAASDLVYDYGYHPPKDLHDLVDATKQLVRSEGKNAVKKLVAIHPDRKAIEKINQPKTDNYCGACNSYNYNGEANYCGGCGHSHYDGQSNPKDFLAQLLAMNLRELETYYDRVIQKSNSNPDDTKLSKEVEMVWNELRKRKAETLTNPETSEEKPTRQARNELVLLGLVFIAGIVVGVTLKKTTHA